MGVLTCDRCKEGSTDVQYVSTGKESYQAICGGCREGLEVENVTPKKQSIPEHLICARCKYNFKHDFATKQSLRCPYCAKSDMIEGYILDSQSLIDEVIERG
ncbi:MAG: hypothetical protein CMH61_00410 [Nanoarchaeota archaeon]|nr:hypothetical protein [Nanoarchaeota archaeon]|tara:strand:+ start:1406 stop:1711 length:306 start_codon:yes stop_codon:yes gene_type:complete